MNRLQPLEPRVVLAATLGPDGVLALTGDDAANAFSLTLEGDQIRVVEFVSADQLFPLSAVTSIRADLGGGDDRLSIAADLTLPTTLAGGAGRDTLVGGGGADLIFGNEQPDLLDGGGGNDTLVGGGGNDRLFGGGGFGKDRLSGEAGDDTLDGQFGDDRLLGGSGSDTVSYADRTAAVTVNVEYAFVWFDPPGPPGSPAGDMGRTGTGGASGETDRYDGVEAFLGGSGDDIFNGSFGGDIQIPYGFLHFWGNDGNDRFEITASLADAWDDPASAGFAYGGVGDDTFVIGYGITQNYFGEVGDDLFLTPTSERAANIDGGVGFDTHDFRDATRASYTIDPGVERFVSQSLALEQLVGNDLDNVIEVVAEGTRIEAAGGNDVVRVSGSRASVFGGAGDDLIVADPSLNNSGGEWALFADGGSGNDRIVGSDNRDRLFGGDGNDTIDTAGGNDVAFGGAGADKLVGSSGRDALFGEGGGDILVGGSGTDYLEGGRGNDRFFTADGESDTLLGGSGANTAESDAALDTLVDILELLP
jgi:Ca2+-binding RTX toxin-like protein